MLKGGVHGRQLVTVRVWAVRRAGRWGKSCPKAEQIAHTQMLIRDSTLEKTFTATFSFFHLSQYTNTTAADQTEASTTPFCKNWFCIIIIINSSVVEPV